MPLCLKKPLFSALLKNYSRKMPHNCVVGGCTRSQKNSPDTSFFRFPKDMKCQRQWIRFVNNTRSDFVKSEHSRVCCAHFVRADFVASSLLKRKFGINGARLLLKTSAVPSVKKPEEDYECASSPPRKCRAAFKKRETKRVG